MAGSCNIDIFIKVPRFPSAGETVSSSATEQAFGGKGANQAVCASRLGAETAMLAQVGDDSDARDYIAFLQREGVKTEGVRLLKGQ